MTIVRNLGPLEREYLRHAERGSTDFCSILFLEGSWPVEAFPGALTRLQHPLLHARICGDQIRYEGPREIPYVILDRLGNEHWRCLVETEIGRPSTEALAEFTVLVGPERSEIIVRLSHAIFDGLSGVAVLKALLAALRGETVQGQIHADMLEGFPEIFRGPLAQERAKEFARLEKAKTARDILRFGEGPATRFSNTAGLELPASFVENLQSLAKRRGVNLFSVVSAASLLAAKNCLPSNNATFAGLAIPMSLRSFLDPSYLEALGLYMSFLATWHDIEQSPWMLAAEIHQGIRNGLVSGEGFLRTHLFEEIDPPRPSISISNVGVIADCEGVGNAKVRGIRSLAALWASDPLSIVLQSYRGNLLIDIHCSREKLDPGAAVAMSTELHRQLAEFIYSCDIPFEHGKHSRV